MVAIFINHDISEHDLKVIRGILKDEAPCEIFSVASLPEDLKKLCMGSGELTPEQKRQVNFEVFERTLLTGEQKVNGTALADLLTFEKANIWHYHKFRLYFQMRNLYYEIEQVTGALEKYEHIHVFTAQTDLELYPFGEKVEVYSGSREQKPGILNYPFGYAFFVIIRVISGQFRRRALKSANHLVVDHTIPQKCLNLTTLKEEMANYNLAYLFQKLENDFLILDDVEIPKAGNGSSYKQRKCIAPAGGFPGENILMRGLMSSKTRKTFSDFNRLLESRYRTMESCCRDPFGRIITNALVRLHKTTRFYLFKYLAYKSHFEKHPVLSVTSIDENSPRIKTILDAAKACNIKTFGIQHGTVHQLHPAYIYTENDRDRHVIPDHTFAWGDHWQQFLHNWGKYPEKSVITVGQLRTDIIPVLLRQGNTQKLSIPTGKKTVMFASQPQRDPRLRRQAALDMFSAVKDMEEIHLVVKLHPAEKNDIGYYRSIAAEAGCSNYTILLYFDLYLLISRSDIVVTCFSTVGAETTYFRKPLIILDHLKQDIQGYHREGIAFQASAAGELRSMIRDILDGKLQTDAKAYERYIEKFAFRIDGKVAERIIQYIRKLSSKE